MVAMPVCAQRGGARGGFSGHVALAPRGGFAGHAASAPRGGFSASAPSRVSGYRGVTVGRSPGFAPNRSAGIVRGLQRGAGGYPGARMPYAGSDHHRRRYERDRRGGFAYVAPGYGWVAPYYPWYPDDAGYDDSSVAQNPAPEGYDPGPQYPQQPELPGVYPPAAAQPNSTAEPSSEEGVTLVFKDGRTPVTVHDYVLTQNTLYVWDRHQMTIPTDQLDLVATAKANRDAGVDFQLPETLR